MDKQNRKAASDDFARSLGQLEHLLGDDSAPKSDSSKANSQGNQTSHQTTHKFGGSILDAIPLAQQLGNRLEVGLENPISSITESSADAEPHKGVAPSKPPHSKTQPPVQPES